MSTPEPESSPASITDRWRDGEQPVEILVMPEQPAAGWIDEPGA